MLPTERGNVLDNVRRRGDALPVELGESRFEIERVPVDDGVDQQVQSGCSIELALEGPIARFSETVGLDTLRDLPDMEALEDAGLLSKDKLLTDDMRLGLMTGEEDEEGLDGDDVTADEPYDLDDGSGGNG